jgi:hypothetical protein
MSEAIPAWLEPTSTKPVVPDWLTDHAPQRAKRSDALPDGKEARALLFAQFEMVLPRVLECVCAGYTLANAIRELPIAVDPGAFVRWLRKKPDLYEMYKEAKEVRTEAWAGEIIRHALGEDDDGNPSPNDTARSRLIVDTYKWLMGADNRKQYGDTKTIEMNTSISITAALAQAQSRVIEAQVIDDDDVDLLPTSSYKQIAAPADEGDDD